MGAEGEGSLTVHQSGRLVRIGYGIVVSERVGIEFDAVDLPWKVELDAEIGLDPEHETGVDRYEIDRLTFIRREGDEPITTENLRRVGVAELAAKLLFYAGKQGAQTKKSSTMEDLRPARPRINDDATLEYVAALYRLAYVLHGDPAKTVADNLELPRATASRWIRRARDKGFLDERAPRRPKGD